MPGTDRTYYRPQSCPGRGQKQPWNVTTGTEEQGYEVPRPAQREARNSSMMEFQDGGEGKSGKMSPRKQHLSWPGRLRCLEGGKVGNGIPERGRSM